MTRARKKRTRRQRREADHCWEMRRWGVICSKCGDRCIINAMAGWRPAPCGSPRLLPPGAILPQNIDWTKFG